MGAPGRPTPQPNSPERPRFHDRMPEDYPRSDINPFVQGHRDYGDRLLPASKAWQCRGNWTEVFGREAPLHVEIGPGNGFFLTELCKRNPDWNILGIELRYKRTVLSARKLDNAGVPNGRVARYHAAYLDDLFLESSLSGLYVNHPDPWPRERHEKHRLVSNWFAADVAKYLVPGAWLRLKSDFLPNVDRMEQLVQGLPLRVTGRSNDVITQPAPWPDDIETNYQRKFRKRGLPVYAIEIVRC